MNITFIFFFLLFLCFLPGFFLFSVVLLRHFRALSPSPLFLVVLTSPLHHPHSIMSYEVGCHVVVLYRRLTNYVVGPLCLLRCCWLSVMLSLCLFSLYF